MMRIIFLSLLSLFILVCVQSCQRKDEVVFPEPATNFRDGAMSSETRTMLVGSTEYKADFCTLTVLENRRSPDSRFIHLPVIRIHAGSEHPREPVFYFAGGPGSSNMDNIEGMWYLMPDHDVILVGFRGIDGSSSLNCPEVQKAMKGIGNELFSEESMKAMGLAWIIASRRLRFEGVDINGYTMIDVVEDNELARKAFGYDKINLKSASYGTRVAYIYSLIHPDKIHRSLMSAANPPGRFVWEPDVIDDQLHYFSELWAKDPEASKRSPDLYSDMAEVLETMPEKWLFMPIDKGKVRVVTFCLLFRKETAAQVFDAYISAREGDYSGLALMSLFYNFVLPDMFNWGDLACKAVSADLDPDRSYHNEMDVSSKHPLGAPVSQLLWGPLDYGEWPVVPIPEPYCKLQYTDVETLIVSGSIDFGTPARFATEEYLPHMRRGKQVILSERGHMDIEWPDPEPFQLMARSFFQTGIPDISLNQPVAVDFTPTMSFTKLMKATLAGIAVGTIVILFLGYALVRFIIRRLKFR